jgi:hypothetical protein
MFFFFDSTQTPAYFNRKPFPLHLWQVASRTAFLGLILPFPWQEGHITLCSFFSKPFGFLLSGGFSLDIIHSPCKLVQIALGEEKAITNISEARSPFLR